MVYTQLENPVKAENLKVRCICAHCGEVFGGNASGKCGLLCKNCRTEKERNAICEENKKIFEKVGKNYQCRHCKVL